MQIMIGSVLTVTVVVLLIVAVRQPAVGRLRELRGACYMLLIGVPALVIQTDLAGIAALSGLSMVVFELVAVVLAL
jgi:hypothetical protein